jgi:RNase P/RNase MRP subunit p29
VNVIGETVTVLSSTDPTKAGKKGLVVLETAKTLVIDTEAGTKTVEKSGSVFRVASSGKVVVGSDIAGRLEDRLGGRPR